MRWLPSATAAASKTMHQQNRPVLNSRCRLMQVDLYTYIRLTVSGSGISWAVCKSAPRSRQITTPAPHSSVFYRPDALPVALPLDPAGGFAPRAPHHSEEIAATGKSSCCQLFTLFVLLNFLQGVWCNHLWSNGCWSGWSVCARLRQS